MGHETNLDALPSLDWDMSETFILIANCTSSDSNQTSTLGTWCPIVFNVLRCMNNDFSFSAPKFCDKIVYSTLPGLGIEVMTLWSQWT